MRSVSARSACTVVGRGAVDEQRDLDRAVPLEAAAAIGGEVTRGKARAVPGILQQLGVDLAGKSSCRLVFSTRVAHDQREAWLRLPALPRGARD
jgi:hypothetical protein